MITRAARKQWVARFDMEALVSAILRQGMVLSLGLISVGVAWRYASDRTVGFEAPLRGTNVLQFLLADIHRVAASPRFWPSAVAHVGVAGLLLIPYLRVLASMLYFVFVERSRAHALLTGLVLVTLTYILLIG